MKSNFLHKLFHWEYWPSFMLYAPNVPFALHQAINAKKISFISAVNPGIKDSGMGTESKFETMQIIPDEHLPKTIFHSKNESPKKTIKKLKETTINFPLIVKPDIGFRGLLVKKITSENELLAYLEKYTIDFLIQEFLNETKECGIFYYRYPNKKTGKITSITLKEFPFIIGDGKSTIKQLIINDKRTKLYLNIIKKNKDIDINTIPKMNQKVQLSVIGNHSKGTQFINGNHLITKKIEQSIDKVCQKINGFYYGRLDIKFDSITDLENGKFKILEINGILAEPTHIYDASKTNYFQAVKEIKKHWKILSKISRINHDEHGIKYISNKKFFSNFRFIRTYANAIKKLSR